MFQRLKNEQFSILEGTKEIDLREHVLSELNILEGVKLISTNYVDLFIFHIDSINFLHNFSNYREICIHDIIVPNT